MSAGSGTVVCSCSSSSAGSAWTISGSSSDHEKSGLLSRDGDERVLRSTSSLSSPVWGSRAAACRLACPRCCRSACFCALRVPRLFLGFGFGVGVV